MIEVTISLISTNERHHLEKLFLSLIPAAQLLNTEILMVDNQSTDGTSEYVRTNFPQVGVVYNSQRQSYGYNHNLNLWRATGKYFVIMNSDIVINSPDLFLQLRDYMDRHPDVGMLSPKILNPDGTVQGLNRRYPTILDLLLRRFLPSVVMPIFKRRMDSYEMRDVGYDHDYDSPLLSGSFMFCRTELLKRIGGFDLRYPMHFDDVDLCRRIQRTQRTVYYHSVSVTHFWKRIPHKSWREAFRFGRMALRYFRQYGFRFY